MENFVLGGIKKYIKKKDFQYKGKFYMYNPDITNKGVSFSNCRCNIRLNPFLLSFIPHS